MSNGKGSKWRKTNYSSYFKNFDEIDWNRESKINKIWIGTYHNCLKHIKHEGDGNYIVTSEIGLRGIREPLEIHICRGFNKLEDWDFIEDNLEVLGKLGFIKKWVDHT